MALNFLLERHQVSLMRAATAASPEADIAHRGMAAAYALRIARLQSYLGGKLVLHVHPHDGRTV